MDERERKAVEALGKMVAQYLHMSDDEVIHTASMGAGESAIEALAAYGIIEVIDARYGRWTPKGKEIVPTWRALLSARHAP